MKGYRTILFHLIMGTAGVIGLQIAPDTAQHWAVIGVFVWMGGGVTLRFLTDTPAFKALPPEVRQMADLVADAAPTLRTPEDGAGKTMAADGTDAATATASDPPADLVQLAASITSALATVQAVHAQVTTALQAAHTAVGAALPASLNLPQGAPAAPQPQEAGHA